MRDDKLTYIGEILFAQAKDNAEGRVFKLARRDWMLEFSQENMSQSDPFSNEGSV